MRSFQLLIWTAAIAIIFAMTPVQVHAWRGPVFSVGIGVGPYWGWGPWGYYRPYPYYYPYYAPPVVYAAPPPVVVQQPTVVSPVPIAPAPAQPIYRAAAAPGSPVSVSGLDHNLQLLTNSSESVRQNAAMDLGRARADQAVDPLCATLAGDGSPSVRDAAARALGLIGASRSLPALIRAAQADSDRDVRHSAQFAVEIIRSNLRER